MRIGISGLMRSRSGIGVLQRRLYPRLEARGVVLAYSSGREHRGGPLRAIIGVVRGWIPAKGTHDAYLSVVPPLPIGVSVRLVTIIYDLRWMRTRGRVGRLYRSWDLRRSVAHSDHLLCISERTLEDLIAFDPRAKFKASVAHLGPGIVDEAPAVAKLRGRVLLIGGAAHKRNEFAAAAIGRARPEWCLSIAGVGLSATAREQLELSIGPEQCNWFDMLSDEELVHQYALAETFVFFGVEEGFGLPYIEALKSDCNVIAIDQPLVRTLLGEAAALIVDGSIDDVAAQLRHVRFPTARTRQLVAQRYSWDTFAAKVHQTLSVDPIGGDGTP